VKASPSRRPRNKLKPQHFDLAILDIMGVDGFNLLKLSRDKNIKAIILTVTP